MKKNNHKYMPLEWIASMILLVILVVIIFWFMSDKQTKTVKADDISVYFIGTLYKYDGKCKITYDGQNAVIKAGKDEPEIVLKDQVLVADKGQRLVTPNSLIYHTGDPSNDLKRVNYFSDIYIDDEKHIVIERDNKKVIVTDGFLYNGADLYVFLEDMTLTIGEEEIQLKPLSYVVVKYQKSLEVYSSETNEYMTMASFGSDIKAVSNRGYVLNLSTDLYETEENEYILFSGIEQLESIN